MSVLDATPPEMTAADMGGSGRARPGIAPHDVALPDNAPGTRLTGVDAPDTGRSDATPPDATPPIIWRIGAGDRAFFIASRLIALAALTVILAAVSPYFLSWGNAANIFRQASLQFLMSAGLTLVVLAGGIDLSVGAVLGLAACLAATFIHAGQIGLGVAAALATGLACGLVNGALATYLRVPAFIATYGMLWIAHGLAYAYMAGDVVYGLPAAFRFIGTGTIGGVAVPIFIGLALLAVLHILLHQTVLGRAIYAIGGNPDAARLCGMRVNARLVTIYALSGLLSGFAALIVIARINSADSSVGEDLLLPTIAAVCLGGTTLGGGTGGIAGTALGALILALILNGMNLLGVTAFWQNGVTGGIILLSLIADRLGEGRRDRA